MDFILDYRGGRSLFTFWSIIIIILFVIYQLVLYFFPLMFTNMCILIHFVKFFIKKTLFLFKLFKKLKFFYHFSQITIGSLGDLVFLPLKLIGYSKYFHSFYFDKYVRILLFRSKKMQKIVKRKRKIQFFLSRIKTVDEREVIKDRLQKFRLTNISEGFFLHNEKLYPDKIKAKYISVKIRK